MAAVSSSAAAADARVAPSLVDGPRTADAIAQALSQRLQADGFAPSEDPLLQALVRVAARYGEILAACVDAGPERQLQACAEMLGRPPRSAAASQAVVRFEAAPAGTATPAAAVVVPARTPLAATAGEPVVFETVAPVTVLRSRIVRAVAVEAGHRRAIDVDAMLGAAGLGETALASARPLQRALYVAPRHADLAGLREIVLQVEVADAGRPNWRVQVEWCVHTDAGDDPLVVLEDGTRGLMRSGTLRLQPPVAWPLTTVAGASARWLVARPRQDPSTLSDAAALDWRTPTLRSVQAEMLAVVAPAGLPVVCNDGVPLDASKDFFPLGERPRFGSVFQVCSPAFDTPGSKVEMAVAMTNPVGADGSPLPVVSRDGQPVIAWELSTANGFATLSVKDGTASLTRSGSLWFTVPADAAAADLTGRRGVWLRARLASGHYGTIAVKEPVAMTLPRAPSIRKLAVGATVQRGPGPVERIALQGGLAVTAIEPAASGAFEAFVSPDVDGAALYLGLAPFAAELVSGCTLSLQVTAAASGDERIGRGRWQARGVSGWTDVQAGGAAADPGRSGIVALTLREPMAPWLGQVDDPTASLRWLRFLGPSVDEPRPEQAQERARGEAPRQSPAKGDDLTAWLPRRLALNAVPAVQLQRVQGELLGSSQGRAGLALRASRVPMVGPVRLQLREADDEWVDWSEVDDLDGAGALDRVFTLDRSTGDVRFGDGRRGRIPPAGGNNVKLADYAVSSGTKGNVPAGSIGQLRRSVPAVRSVVNLEPATGGLDVESDAQRREHALGWLRHRGRAVCADDYEVLARQASPAVARAYCIAGRDLRGFVNGEPDRRQPDDDMVSLIVVPHADDPRPSPAIDLLESVSSYLDPRRPPAGRLVVVGPSYASASVSAEVRASPDAAGDVGTACRSALAAFLHPLTGGPAGTGWRPGQRPHRSDIHGVLAGVDGVAMVLASSLRIDLPGPLQATGRADPAVLLVSAGTIDVKVHE